MTSAFKLLLLGDGGVGKTTLAQRYATGSFISGAKMTIGASFHSAHLAVGGDDIVLQIWDLGGEGRFRFFLPTLCAGASGAIFAYDVTRMESLLHVGDWMAIFQEQAAGIPVIMVGMKADLDQQRAVQPVDAEAIAAEQGIADVIETSAMTGQNVELVFETITSLMLNSPAAHKYEVPT
jgi:small GTP-binding protein